MPLWIPKYREKILAPEIAEYAKQVLQRVAEEYDMVIDTMDIVEDHVHAFLEAPPRLSPSRIVQILKSIWVCFISVEKDRCDALLGAKQTQIAGKTSCLTFDQVRRTSPLTHSKHTQVIWVRTAGANPA